MVTECRILDLNSYIVYLCQHLSKALKGRIMDEMWGWLTTAPLSPQGWCCRPRWLSGDTELGSRCRPPHLKPKTPRRTASQWSPLRENNAVYCLYCNIICPPTQIIRAIFFHLLQIWKYYLSLHWIQSLDHSIIGFNHSILYLKCSVCVWQVAVCFGPHKHYVKYKLKLRV